MRKVARKVWKLLLFSQLYAPIKTGLNDLIVLHPLGIFIFVFINSFLVRKIPFAGIELTSQRVRGLRGTSELPGFYTVNRHHRGP